MTHSLFNRSPTDGHLYCFQSLVIIINCAVNKYVVLLFCTFALISVGQIPGSEIAGSRFICDCNFMEINHWTVPTG